MITEYELWPNIRWHDGTPFTASDYLFGRQFYLNKNVPVVTRFVAEKVALLQAVGPYKLVAYWKEKYPFANLTFGSGAYPEHVLGVAYKQGVGTGDYKALIHHRYWTVDYFSNGPYKLAEWVRRSHIKLVRNDDFFLTKLNPEDYAYLKQFYTWVDGPIGPEYFRPKFDEIVWRFIEDTMTLEVMLRTGELDANLGVTIPFDQALALFKDVQAGKVAADIFVGFVEAVVWEHIDINKADDAYYQEQGWPIPKYGYMREAFRDVRVRQALVHAIDREAITQVMFEGRQKVSHAPLQMKHPLMSPEAEAVMTVYEYDPAKARELLAAAGWTPGPDGILRDAQKKVGIETEIDNMPASALFSKEHMYELQFPGAIMFAWVSYPTSLGNTLWHSEQIPPKGQNVAFYVNPVVDELYDQILAELDEGKRRELYVGIVEQWTKDIPSIPLYFRADPYVHKANIVGIKPTGTADPVAWNVWEWDWK